MKEIKIHEKNKHITESDRNDIATCLNRGFNLTDTAKFIHCSVSTIKREIDKHKVLQVNTSRNQCGYKKVCTITNLCNSKCTRECSQCITKSCNTICNLFTKFPQCKKLKRMGGVCNGCDEKQYCRLNKYFYVSSKAQNEYLNNISESHKGASISQEELIRLDQFLFPLIKKGLSFEIIVNKYPNIVPYSIQTLYNYVDKGYLPSLKNIDLLRKVSYSPRKKEKETKPQGFTIGREYTEFIKYITEHPDAEIVEMDTVEGPGHASSILTLLFRRSYLLLAFKLERHDSESVEKVFNHIKKTLGEELFKELFEVILTDRGVEFSHPSRIEQGLSSKSSIVHVFYCDPRCSNQKGQIERIHQDLRRIYPKGKADFNDISQDDLNEAVSNINSIPRKKFNYSSPLELARKMYPTRLLALNNLHFKSLNEINLTPKKK